MKGSKGKKYTKQIYTDKPEFFYMQYRGNRGAGECCFSLICFEMLKFISWQIGLPEKNLRGLKLHVGAIRNQVLTKKVCGVTQ